MRRLCRRALFCACPKRSDQHFDAFSDLQEILREAGQDAEFLQQLETELGAFTARMPHELDALVTDLESVRGGDGCRGAFPLRRRRCRAPSVQAVGRKSVAPSAEN